MNTPTENFPIQVGDRVEHIKEPGMGTVIHIDWNLIPTHDTSTCLVIWDDDPDKIPDIQWLDKLAKV